MSKGTAGPGFIVLTLIFLGVFYSLRKIKTVQSIKENWEKNRCRPDIMFFAGMYGYDTSENIQFCLSKMFNSQAGSTVAPFYSYIKMFIGILGTLLQSINSIRLTFATLVGSITTVMSNFNDRIQQLFARIKITFLRMKYLMGRVYGTMFAIIYMMMSGMTAVNNFGNSFLFKFLDTFCFDPDTPIEVSGKGVLPISQVRIGDRLTATGSRVTSTFQFIADGQPMVRIGPVLVSTNHYILHANKWIRAEEFPDAVPAEPWSGGISRPLICLNTEDHRIPLAGYIFRDYDEAEEADEATMNAVLAQLNGNPPPTESACPQDIKFSYSTCISPLTKIRMKDGNIRMIQDLQLGDSLSTGRVLGIVKKEVDAYSTRWPSCTPGCAVWDSSANNGHGEWVRAASPESLRHPHIQEWMSLVVESGQFELEDGLRVRDYVEIHSPDTNLFYNGALQQKTE